jgi:Zinc carboxypeptidase
MKTSLIVLLTLAVLFVQGNARAQKPKDLADFWEKQHISKMFPSNVRHKDLKNYLEQLKKLEIKVEEVGRSYGNREIYQIEWGKGATRVFLWSQMHGDEPTATSALIDMFAFLQKNRDKDWVKRMEETLTIRAVPMLNPDGAEIFQRRNLQGIDINRDASNLQSPEAQLLKRLRDAWQPHIGFNLHNQNNLTTVSGTTNQAAISFLVVEGQPELRNNEGNERNKRLTAAMIVALQNFIPGSIGRYVDAYNPLAFGDKFSDWGTPVILIETGALHGKDEMFLVKMNFVAFLTALNALVDGSEKSFSTFNYDVLPKNGSGNLFNYIFRRANIVNNSGEILEIQVSDIALNTMRRPAREFVITTVQTTGSLVSFRGLEEYDTSGFYLFPKFGGALRAGTIGEFLFYKKDRQIDWKAFDLEKQFPPDAIFSGGKWIKPLPKLN